MKYLILAVILLSCHAPARDIEWIENADRPIECRYVGSDAIGNVKYTLIDSKGRIYATKYIPLNLPDILK